MKHSSALVKKREQRARTMLAKYEQRLALVLKGHAKWRAKVDYYNTLRAKLDPDFVPPPAKRPASNKRVTELRQIAVTTAQLLGHHPGPFKTHGRLRIARCTRCGFRINLEPLLSPGDPRETSGLAIRQPCPGLNVRRKVLDAIRRGKTTKP